MLKRLFEIEVPEVYNGVVEIKVIAREAGFRSKVAVSATQPGIDPVGSCIGIRGNRIQSIVNELQGEKIDIVSWDEEPKTFIANALSPSEPVHVELLEQEQTAIVVVPDRQLSLAIGKEGQNTRLAARLTGWRLDIKGLTEWEEIKERTQSKAGAKASTADGPDSPVVEATDAEEAVEEAIAIVEEAGAIAAEDAVASEPVAEAAQVAEAAVETADEDSILEALIKEEEDQATVEEAAEPIAAEGLSVEDLGAFTIDDVELSEDDDEDEEEEEEGELPDFTDLPVLIPDAGKIRFAEDIVEEFRGGGRGGRRRRGGGARGGGARGGGAAAGGGR
jgi:N utilization substance protein A